MRFLAVKLGGFIWARVYLGEVSCLGQRRRLSRATKADRTVMLAATSLAERSDRRRMHVQCQCHSARRTSVGPASGAGQRVLLCQTVSMSHSGIASHNLRNRDNCYLSLHRYCATATVGYWNLLHVNCYSECVVNRDSPPRPLHARLQPQSTRKDSLSMRRPSDSSTARHHQTGALALRACNITKTCSLRKRHRS